MKKFQILFAICFVIFTTSCTHTLYNPKILQGNYDVRMDTKEDLEIKGKVRIFLSEKDIAGDYEVISLNQYKPFKIPIIMTQKGQINKKFYEKAAQKAYEQGGNGIIISGAGIYKVISLYNWNSDDAASEKYVNAILDTKLMDRFTNGEVAKLFPREIKKCVKDLNNEIVFNLKTARTSEEAKVIGKKIKALQDWYNSQPNTKSNQNKQIEAYQKIHKAISKKIAKKEAKNKQ